MSCATKIPRGDVTVPLNFYEAPANGSEPYFVISREDGIAPEFNFSDKSVDVIVHDIRGSENNFNLDRDAFQIVTDASPPSEGIDFTDDESIRVNYYPNIQQLIAERLPGDLQIFIYDHTVRHQVEGGAPYRPLTRVHIDHTTNNAIRRVRQFFPTEADRLLQGRYRIVNVWRPLNKRPLESYPLAFASASTFDNADVVPIQHRYKDGSLVREAGLIKHSSSQAWYYLSGMTDRERILLKSFDSDSLAEGSEVACKTPHTAFRDPRTQASAEGRFSIEVLEKAAWGLAWEAWVWADARGGRWVSPGWERETELNRTLLLVVFMILVFRFSTWSRYLGRFDRHPCTLRTVYSP